MKQKQERNFLATNCRLPVVINRTVILISSIHDRSNARGAAFAHQSVWATQKLRTHFLRQILVKLWVSCRVGGLLDLVGVSLNSFLFGALFVVGWSVDDHEPTNHSVNWEMPPPNRSIAQILISAREFSVTRSIKSLLYRESESPTLTGHHGPAAPRNPNVSMLARWRRSR